MTGHGGASKGKPTGSSAIADLGSSKRVFIEDEDALRLGPCSTGCVIDWYSCGAVLPFPNCETPATGGSTVV